MARPARPDEGRSIIPRSRTFGTAAATSRQRLAWIWSRESLLRLLLSLVLALALWLYISNKQNPSIAQDFGQPLSITDVNVPDGMALLNDNLGEVYVRIKRTDPNTPVTLGSFHAFVDLLGLRPGQHRVPVQVIADPGIEVVQKRPSAVQVVLQRIQSRHVPAQPNVISRPPTGYGYQIQISPGTVIVAGPKDLVSQVARATFDLDLSGLRTNVAGTYKVRPENSQGALVTGHLFLEPSQVHATVRIQALSSYKTLPVLAELRGQPKTGYGVVSLVAKPAQITVTGSPERLSSISTVKALVSVARRGGGTFTARVPLKIPKNTTSHSRYVTVRVRLAPVQSSNAVQIAVASVGVAPGLVARIRPAQVFTTVVGPSTALRSAGSHVRAVLDLTGYGPGTYTLTPAITSSGKVHVVSFSPPTVTVTLAPESSGPAP